MQRPKLIDAGVVLQAGQVIEEFSSSIPEAGLFLSPPDTSVELFRRRARIPEIVKQVHDVKGKQRLSAALQVASFVHAQKFGKATVADEVRVANQWALVDGGMRYKLNAYKDWFKRMQDSRELKEMQQWGWE